MDSSQTLTPMMRQYRKTKQEIPEDTLLLFRMGDFYEMFFEDAERGSQIFEITLTKRQGIPMAGIPYHALQNYLPKALEAGIKVALAEQTEDPKLAKGLVRREVTQIITPGTIVEGDVLNAGRSNYLMGVNPGRGGFGIAVLDISTGEFRVCEVSKRPELDGEIHRLRPSEVLLPQRLHEQWERENGFPDVSYPVTWTPAEDWTFMPETAQEELCRHFAVSSLDGFGCGQMHMAVGAAGGVLHYACNNLRRDASHITRLQPYSINRYMGIDRITQRNLELVEPLYRDHRNATLFAVLNHTVTPMGTRLLREWILRPLIRHQEIVERQDAVEAFVQDQLLLEEVRSLCKHIRDMERIITKLNVGSGNARDLLSIKKALEVIPLLRETLAVVDENPLLGRIQSRLIAFPQLVELIEQAIVDDPPTSIRDGGMIREGFNEQLDEYRAASSKGKDWIVELQQKEQERTGISTLKVKYNKVFGYFIEVRKTQVDRVPPEYIRKQTLTQAERFITPELKEIEPGHYAACWLRQD